MGIKIVATGLEKTLAGTGLMVVRVPCALLLLLLLIMRGHMVVRAVCCALKR